MDALTYEWRRARTIRTTWITGAFVVLGLLALGLLGQAVISAVEGSGAITAASIVDQSLISNPIVIVLVSSLGAMAFGHEYRYGTIRLTLTAFPKRGVVFVAKLVMTLLVCVAAVVAAVAVTYAALAAVQGTALADTGISVPTLAWHALVFAVTYGLLAFAVTVITRNHPLGIVAPLLLFMIELLMVPALAGRLPWLPDLLPITAMGNWFNGESVAAAVAVWAVWIGALLAIGLILLRRRDA